MSASVKSLYVIDPALTERRGHMYNIAVGLADTARRAGLDCRIFANRLFRPEPQEEPFLIPLFTETTLTTEPSTSLAWKYLNLNRLFLRHLKELSAQYDFRDSIVVFPTANQLLIDAIQRWNVSLPPGNRTTMIVSLMLQAGVLFESETEFVVKDLEMANVYRTGLAGFARPGQENCVLCSNTESIIRAYSALYGGPIRFHPTLCGTPDPRYLLEGRAARQGRRPQVVLYIGEIKPDKGFHLVPDVLTQALERGLPADYFIQIHGVEGYRIRFAAEIERIRELAAANPNVRVVEGFLSCEDYYRTVSSAGAFVLPYDSEIYRDMSSGVLMEALYYDAPVVVPTASWMDVESKAYKAGRVTFERMEAGEITDALARLLEEHPEHAARSAEAGQRYRDANGFDRFLDVAMEWHSEPRPERTPIGDPGRMAWQPIFA
ncbi:glycosyltransferase [Azospirillum sp.]|uniref:glycosyltransferase n=1 Tax=Azospirillum sp. TaxID=34012 RepID=UPI002D45BAD2|nr:glycosyltransferase [Azospirillum sp.]HYD63878.1 glycosyltransferase [Azospirillum sp.]